MNSGLRMSKGKAASQAAHAAIQGFLMLEGANERHKWNATGSPIVVLSASEDILRSLHAAYPRDVALIEDGGLTEVPSGSLTCIAALPHRSDGLERAVKQFSLYH